MSGDVNMQLVQTTSGAVLQAQVQQDSVVERTEKKGGGGASNFRNRHLDESENTRMLAELLDRYRKGNLFQRIAARNSVNAFFRNASDEEMPGLIKDIAETFNPLAWKFMKKYGSRGGGACTHKLLFQSLKDMDFENADDIISYASEQLERNPGLREAFLEAAVDIFHRTGNPFLLRVTNAVLAQVDADTRDAFIKKHGLHERSILIYNEDKLIKSQTVYLPEDPNLSRQDELISAHTLKISRKRLSEKEMKKLREMFGLDGTIIPDWIDRIDGLKETRAFKFWRRVYKWAKDSKFWSSIIQFFRKNAAGWQMYVDGKIPYVIIDGVLVFVAPGDINASSKHSRFWRYEEKSETPKETPKDSFIELSKADLTPAGLKRIESFIAQQKLELASRNAIHLQAPTASSTQTFFPNFSYRAQATYVSHPFMLSNANQPVPFSARDGVDGFWIYFLLSNTLVAIDSSEYLAHGNFSSAKKPAEQGSLGFSETRKIAKNVDDVSSDSTGWGEATRAVHLKNDQLVATMAASAHAFAANATSFFATTLGLNAAKKQTAQPATMRDAQLTENMPSSPQQTGHAMISNLQQAENAMRNLQQAQHAESSQQHANTARRQQQANPAGNLALSIIGNSVATQIPQRQCRREANTVLSIASNATTRISENTAVQNSSQNPNQAERQSIEAKQANFAARSRIHEPSVGNAVRHSINLHPNKTTSSTRVNVRMQQTAISSTLAAVHNLSNATSHARSEIHLDCTLSAVENASLLKFKNAQATASAERVHSREIQANNVREQSPAIQAPQISARVDLAETNKVPEAINSVHAEAQAFNEAHLKNSMAPASITYCDAMATDVCAYPVFEAVSIQCTGTSASMEIPRVQCSEFQADQIIESILTQANHHHAQPTVHVPVEAVQLQVVEIEKVRKKVSLKERKRLKVVERKAVEKSVEAQEDGQRREKEKKKKLDLEESAKLIRALGGKPPNKNDKSRAGKRKLRELLELLELFEGRVKRRNKKWRKRKGIGAEGKGERKAAEGKAAELKGSSRK